MPKNYHIYALDGTDDDALNRRLSVRSIHFEGIEKLRANNQFIFAAALLNEKKEMIGSTLSLTFEDRNQLDDWLKQEPYVKHGVWKSIQINEIAIPNFDKK